MSSTLQSKATISSKKIRTTANQKSRSGEGTVKKLSTSPTTLFADHKDVSRRSIKGEIETTRILV